MGFGAGRMSAPSGVSTAKRVVELSNASESSDVEVNESKTMGGRDGEKQISPVDQLKPTVGMTDPKARDREMENALSRASLVEAKNALEWALSLPESGAKRALLGKIMERWGQLDGAQATAYAEKILAESGDSQFLKNAIRGWGQTDPGASIQYSQSIPASEGIKRDVLRDLVRDWADRNAQAVAAFAAGNAMDVGRGGVMGLIAERWSKQDPQAAANWAMSLPPGRDQQRALDQLVQNWSDLNLQAAADFINRQPTGANKDVMVSALAREVAKQDAAAALQWASTLSNPDTQSRAVLSFMWRSASQDLASARQMVISSGLSQAAKESVLNRMTNGYGGRRGGGQ